MSAETDLIEQVAAYRDDPLGFVMFAFPWGEDGALRDIAGPRQWQRETLTMIGERVRAGAGVGAAIQIATASGHGIGKSALVAMVMLWAMSTRPDTRGVVTANTENQLRTKTWAELSKWFRLLICRSWFDLSATALASNQDGHDKTWRIDAIPWSLNNTEAFAGLHNKGRRVLVVFDEASSIPDAIWEVTEGALTDEDTEILWLAFGNPTRNTGRLRECFGRLRHRWLNRQIDSRDVEGTNKEQFAKWIEDYGEDSDFVRVRVRGEFPRAGVTQFISSEDVERAQARKIEAVDHGAPLILGVDIARFGDDKCVIRGRQGRDGRPFKAIKWRGMDTMYSAGRIADAIQRMTPDQVFVDGGGIGGAVVDILRSWGYKVQEINFGSTARDERKYANKRAEMWGDVKDWLTTGALEDDRELFDDLIGPEYGFDRDNRILLERKADMKARGLASPDDGDAFALTFAQPVQRKDMKTSRGARPKAAVVNYRVLG